MVPGSTAIRGADANLVREAVATGTALPGTGGYAGRLDGVLVRDVLGRELVYVEAEATEAPIDPGPAEDDTGIESGAGTVRPRPESAIGSDSNHGESPTDGPAYRAVDAELAVPEDDWAHDPDDLDEPALVPAGHVVTADGRHRFAAVPRPEPADEGAAVAAVRSALQTSLAVAACAADSDTPGPDCAADDFDSDGSAVDSDTEDPDVAVALSGGVDSAVLAARWDAPAYVAGFPDSDDVAAARTAADRLDVTLTVVELDHETLAAAVPRVARAIGRTNAMDVAIALPLVLAAERAAADGHGRLGVGQGADELFGGYAKVEQAPDDPRTDADTVRGARDEVVRSLPAQLERDLRALRSAGVEPVTPYLHDAVVEAALAVPESLLVADGRRKVALRRAVAPWLSDDLAARPKKAIQYGSDVSRELDRLARQAGFKRRMDDHVSQYVAERVAEDG